MALVAALRSLIAIDAFAHLGCTLSHLAGATATCPDILRRLLRVVVEHGIVKFTPFDNTYRNTRVSSAYLKSSRSSKFLQTMYDFHLAVDIPGWITLRATNKHHKSIDDAHNAFTFTSGREGVPLWKILEDQPSKLERFHDGLETIKSLNPFSTFQYHTCLRNAVSFNDRSISIVDIGGGNGQFLADLLRSNTFINPKRAILQDFPWALEYADRNDELSGEVIRTAHDFFSPQPVLAAHIYHIRACLHRWSDEQCVKILKHIKEAMGFDSRLLVAENVISRCPLEGESAGAMDLFMLGIGGRERTLHEFYDIFRQADLQLDAVWPLDTGHWTVLQASKAP